MNRKRGRDEARVDAMKEAAEEARRDAQAGRDAFLRPGLTQKGVLLDLIHLTESAERTSRGFKDDNPLIPWSRLTRLRNRGLVHDYAGASLEDIWEFVTTELAPLRRRLDKVKFRDDDAP